MPSVLEELYYGNIGPSKKIHGQDSPFVQAAKLKSRNLDKLMELLNEQEKELFEKYADTQSELEDISSYAKFTYGLKFGVLLMAEVFVGMGEVTD